MRPALQAMAQVPWIVHDFSGDGIVFKRLYDVVPDIVFDTMLLSRALGYPQPGLKTMAKLKLGLEIPKEEQDSNWMLRPLREAQISYATRDAALLLPLLSILAEEGDAKRQDPEMGPACASLPKEMRHLLNRVRALHAPGSQPGGGEGPPPGPGRGRRWRSPTARSCAWGNEGDVGAVMELGNRWIMARLAHPPKPRRPWSGPSESPVPPEAAGGPVGSAGGELVSPFVRDYPWRRMTSTSDLPQRALGFPDFKAFRLFEPKDSYPAEVPPVRGPAGNLFHLHRRAGLQAGLRGAPGRGGRRGPGHPRTRTTP